MDFEFSSEQEMLRESVRAFLAAKAPITLGARRVRRRRAPTARVWDGLVELGAGRPARRRGARRRGHGHGRRRGRARGARPRGVPGAVRVVGDRRGLARRRRAAPPPGRRLGDRHGRDLRGRRPLRLAAPGDAARSRDGDGVAARRHQGARRRRRSRPTSCSSPRSTTTAGSACSRPSSSRAESTPTVDGSRKQGRVVFAGARGSAHRRPATPTTAVARTLDRLGVAAVVDGVGAAQRALELVGRVREGARAVRQADRRVPSRATPLRRHAAHRRARPGRGLLRVLGARRRRRPRRRTARRRWRAAFAADAFPQLGGTAIQVFGGIGFTWEHDIHLYYKRLLTVAHALGTASDHLEELATIAIG